MLSVSTELHQERDLIAEERHATAEIRAKEAGERRKRFAQIAQGECENLSNNNNKLWCFAMSAVPLSELMLQGSISEF